MRFQDKRSILPVNSSQILQRWECTCEKFCRFCFSYIITTYGRRFLFSVLQKKSFNPIKFMWSWFGFYKDIGGLVCDEDNFKMPFHVHTLLQSVSFFLMLHRSRADVRVLLVECSDFFKLGSLHHYMSTALCLLEVEESNYMFMVMLFTWIGYCPGVMVFLFTGRFDVFD